MVQCSVSRCRWNIVIALPSIMSGPRPHLVMTRHMPIVKAPTPTPPPLIGLRCSSPSQAAGAPPTHALTPVSCPAGQEPLPAPACARAQRQSSGRVACVGRRPSTGYDGQANGSESLHRIGRAIYAASLQVEDVRPGHDARGLIGEAAAGFRGIQRRGTTAGRQAGRQARRGIGDAIADRHWTETCRGTSSGSVVSPHVLWPPGAHARHLSV